VTKRVALLVPSLVAGGAERGAIFVGQVLERAGYAVDLVVAVSKGALLEDTWASAHLVALDAPAELLALPGWLRYLDRARPHLAISFVHSANLVSGLGGWLRPQVPFIVSLRNSLEVPPADRWWVRRWLGMAPERRLYARARFVQAVSQEVLEQAAALFAVPPERLWLTYNTAQALDGEPPRLAAAGEAEAIAALGPYLVSAGRLVSVKGFDTVIRAFAAARLPAPWRLVIVGDGPLRAQLEALARAEGAAGSVTFAGYRDPLLPWLEGARGFVFGSHGEGFPRVLHEALLARLPVAAPRAPGMGDVLQQGQFGRLLPLGDAPAMAEAMKDIAAGRLGAPEPRALAAHLARFTPDAVGERYLAMVRAAIGAP
jgi:glycosyltransferase involved in cell wall biosynthesis